MKKAIKSVLHEFEDVRLLLGIGGGVAAFLVTVATFLHEQLDLSEDAILNFAYFASLVFIMGFMYFGVSRRGVKIGKLEAVATKSHASADTRLVQERQQAISRATFYNQMVGNRDAELVRIEGELAQMRIENNSLALENSNLKHTIVQAYKEKSADEIHEILKPTLDSFGRGDFTIAGNG